MSTMAQNTPDNGVITHQNYKVKKIILAGIVFFDGNFEI
jgi:hypothetical protein